MALDIGVELSDEDQKILRDEGPDNQPKEEPKAEPDAKTEQPRDETGKFAKEEQKPEEKKADAEDESDITDKDSPEVIANKLKAALREERRKHREERQKDAEERAKLAGKLDLLAQKFAQSPQEQPKPVDVEQDPISALKETRQELQTVRQQQDTLFAKQRFATHVAAQIEAFKNETPDYGDAYQFARQAYASELRDVYGVPENQIPDMLAQAEFNLAASALQRGVNPGQAVYAFAQARGYRKAEPKSEPKADAKPSAQEKLETIEKGQQAAKSLGSSGGAPPAKLSLEKVANMSEAEIAALTQDQFRALFE